jgi:hypothetical protein
MSRRNWLMTGAALLGVALVPGCAPSLAQTMLDPRDHVPDLPDLRSRGPESPYHQQLNAGPAPSGPADRKDVRERQALPEEPPRLAPPAVPGPAPDALPPLTPQTAEKPAPAVKPTPDPEPQRTADDEPLVVALRAYLHKRSPDALAAIGHYAKPNQDMLLVALPLVARLTEGDIDRVSPREAAELADLLQGVEDRLRQRAALRVEKMLFCRKIDDFGDYVAREPVNGLVTFEGGAGDQVGEPVQVYVELRNVANKQEGEYYETRLAGAIELIDFEGRSAYRRDFAPKLHRGQSPRHDFFVECSFSVPRKVPPGRYTLRVEVRDITGLPTDQASGRLTPPTHRVAHQTLDLQVIAPKAERLGTAAR